MSRTGGETWFVRVPRQDQDSVPVRIRVRGEIVTVQVGGAKRALIFDARLLAELVTDLMAAGRALRSNQAAVYVAKTGREQRGPAAEFEPILSPEDVEALDAEADRRLAD